MPDDIAIAEKSKAVLFVPITSDWERAEFPLASCILDISRLNKLWQAQKLYRFLRLLGVFRYHNEPAFSAVQLVYIFNTQKETSETL